jgi:hypothetical protein
MGRSAAGGTLSSRSRSDFSVFGDTATHARTLTPRPARERKLLNLEFLLYLPPLIDKEYPDWRPSKRGSNLAASTLEVGDKARIVPGSVIDVERNDGALVPLVEVDQAAPASEVADSFERLGERVGVAHLSLAGVRDPIKPIRDFGRFSNKLSFQIALTIHQAYRERQTSRCGSELWAEQSEGGKNLWVVPWLRRPVFDGMSHDRLAVYQLAREVVVGG